MNQKDSETFGSSAKTLKTEVYASRFNRRLCYPNQLLHNQIAVII